MIMWTRKIYDYASKRNIKHQRNDLLRKCWEILKLQKGVQFTTSTHSTTRFRLPENQSNRNNSAFAFLWTTLTASTLALCLQYQSLCEANPDNQSADDDICLDDQRDYSEMKNIAPLSFHSKYENVTDVPESKVKMYYAASYEANDPIEDRYDTLSEKSGETYLAVYDGHGGWQVSEYAKNRLVNLVKTEISLLQLQDNEKISQSSKIAQAIERAFLRTDRELIVKVMDAFGLGFGDVARVGSCALLAYLLDDLLIIANAGDVRAIVGTTSKSSQNNIQAIPLSNDHNAKIFAEQSKLDAEHPNEADIVKCKHADSCYVKGRLQPTRSLGDLYLKYSEFNGPPYKDGDRSRGRHISPPYTPPYITAKPEISIHRLQKEDKFLVIGSDGLWDFLSNEEVVSIVEMTCQNGTPELASVKLIQTVLERSANKHHMTIDQLLNTPKGRSRRIRHDDTTVIVAFFDNHTKSI